MSRLIVLDCETTGLDFKNDRIIELGCVELWELMPTGNEFHIYINPKKLMDSEVIGIHGISNEFLRDKKEFSHYTQEIIDFIGNSAIIAHNAEFDLTFLNEEFSRLGRESLPNEIIDTLKMARKLYGTGNSLDNLCRRYNVNNSMRKTHGALMDAQLLSKVYYFLLQEYNSNIFNDLPWIFDEEQKSKEDEVFQFPHRDHHMVISSEDEKLHEEFCKKLKI